MITSPTDHKSYQSLTLANGLRVLLVHNDQSQKAAAALAVNVGHFSDPTDRQGLAHFLEHMLFLGTKKYPDGSEYQKFISQYGGSNNAWTATEHTCFFFDIHHHHYSEALDRFSQFFIAPLLSEEFVNKERKNIDAEFKLKLKDDIRRLYDVHKETINPEHPFAKFSVGNTETLNDKPNRSLRDEVEAFFSSYYVAKAMTLVLEGPQSLEQLSEYAEQYFSDISSNSLGPKCPDVPLYLPEHQQLYIQVKPMKNERQLIISFALPNIDQYYREKPESLLAYLIGHEGKHSILSTLKKYHWALGLSAGSGVNGYNFKDFNISVRLTELGEQNIDAIMQIVFAYIEKLKAAPLADFYYQEKKSIAELSFHYHEKVKPLDSVCQLVINMQHYPEQDYIYGDYRMDGLNQQAIADMVQKFTPQNMRYLLISQSNKTHEISRWYQVPYQPQTISEDQISLWLNGQVSDTLALPEQNRYIVTQPDVYPDEPHQSVVPSQLHRSNGYHFWYKQDQTFKVPKGYLYLGIDSPHCLANDKHIAMTKLFVDLYTDSVIEEHYDAELAGIHYHLYAHQGGLTLQLSGLSTKQNLLLEQLLTELLNCQFSPDKFLLMKSQLQTHWRNNDNSKSISQLFSALSSQLQPKNPSPQSLASALEQISFAEFEQFVAHIFTEIKIDVLLHGNWRTEDADAFHHTIFSVLGTHCSDQYKAQIPLIDIASKGNIALPLYLPEHDHAAVIHYLMPDKSLKTTALTMVISQILAPQFFHQMRTEKQYGYLVGVGFVPIVQYPGLAFYIQSPNFDAEHLIDAMNQFIEHSPTLIEQMPDDEWQHLKHGLASQLQEKDTSLRIKSQRFWNAICNDDLAFNQKLNLIDELLSLELSDLMEYCQQQLVPENVEADRITLTSIKTPLSNSQEKNKNRLKNYSIKF